MSGKVKLTSVGEELADLWDHPEKTEALFKKYGWWDHRDALRAVEEAARAEARLGVIREVAGQGTNVVHVLPTLGNHDSNANCWCGPYRDPSEPRVWIHRENHVA